MAIRFMTSVRSGRWVTPYHGGVATSSQTFTVGRVLLVQFELIAPRVVDGLAYIVGAVSAGSVTAGIVGPIASATDTALAAPVVAQSASTAQGTINTAQFLSWTPVLLPAGVYYAALEGSDVTGTYMRQPNGVQATGLVQFYDRAGGYGTLTDPTPAVTDTGSSAPGLRIRLV